jgi:hypothetical protein
MMPPILNKQEILAALNSAAKELTSFSYSITDTHFFKKPGDQWSAAQNVEHLIKATNMTRLVFQLPKFFLTIYTGKPNRPSRSYDELVTKYKLKLNDGGRASGRYIPGHSTTTTREKLITTFSNSMIKLEKKIEKNWVDEQLDQYIAPHPLLGKITLRELCYFTIYHTQHHLDIIRKRVS